MSAADILTCYQQILGTSRRMNELAKSESWDAFIECELSRRQQLAQLRQHLEAYGTDKALPPDLMLASNECVHEILTLDQQTTDLAERWMAELGKDLQTVNTAQRLRRTYITP